MEPLLLLLAAVVLFVVPIWLLVRSGYRKVLAAMRLAGEELGLEVRPGSPWGQSASLAGRIDDLEVTARGVGGQNQGRYLEVWMSGGGLDPTLRVAEREARGPSLGGQRVSIGDPLFDHRWLVEGPAGLALTLLDEPARSALLEAGVDVSVEAREGGVHVRRVGGDVRWDLIVDAVNAGLEVARRLRPPPASELPDRLAERAATDPEPGARLEILRLLLRDHADAPATGRALEALADDPEPQVRRLVLQARGVDADGQLSLAEAGSEGALSEVDPAGEGALSGAD